MNKVVVKSTDRKYGVFEKRVRKAAGAALSFLGKDGFLVEVNLVSDAEIKKLNRRFRKKDKATNVLSFSEPKNFPFPESRLHCLGEVYLAPDYIRKREENFSLLVVHGVLHLLGFSHSHGSDRIEMERLEDKILQNV